MRKVYVIPFARVVELPVACILSGSNQSNVPPPPEISSEGDYDSETMPQL